jgi:UDP-N-acetylmuramoyl-tripeptide--D-alanyl-D-alanine ligase
MLTLADIIEALSGARPDWARLVITEAVIDSRQVIPGSLFIALPGERVDGHDYVAQAFERGASVAMVQKELPGRFTVLDLRKDQTIPEQVAKETQLCIRVDNTLTALQRVASFWRRRLTISSPDLRVIGITGSVGKSTTKELVAEVLSQRYRTLKNPGNLNNEIGLPLTLLSLGEGHERAVLEMGFYVGEIAFVRSCASAGGVITNVGTVHAERAVPG